MAAKLSIFSLGFAIVLVVACSTEGTNTPLSRTTSFNSFCEHSRLQRFLERSWVFLSDPEFSRVAGVAHRTIMLQIVCVFTM